MVEEDEKLNKVKIEKKKKIERMLKMCCKKSFVNFIAKLPLLYKV